MKINVINLAGMIICLLAIVLSGLIIVQFPFPTFNAASRSDQFISVTGDVGAGDSSFMWTNRTLDLIAQAFVVLSAAIGSLAMLRAEEGEHEHA